MRAEKAAVASQLECRRMGALSGHATNAWKRTRLPAAALHPAAPGSQAAWNCSLGSPACETSGWRCETLILQALRDVWLDGPFLGSGLGDLWGHPGITRLKLQPEVSRRGRM